jgi:hypothetical protein
VEKMTRPITWGKIKFYWWHNKRKVYGWLGINLLIYSILAGGVFIAYQDYQKLFLNDFIAFGGRSKGELAEQIRVCSLKEVVCKDTGDLLIDTLDGTPMESAIEPIRNAAKHYGLPIELFLGVANAESSFKNFLGNNPYGIGVGGPRSYTSLEHSTNGFAQLVKYYYFNEGKDTPEEMLLKYVGWNNKQWVSNVRKYWNPESSLTMK